MMYTVEQTAKILGRTIEQIQKMIKNGMLKTENELIYDWSIDTYI